MKSLRSKISKSWRAYTGAELFSIHTITTHLIISLALFLVLILGVQNLTSLTITNTIESVLAIFTLMMVLEISRQVQKQSEQLQNFEPSVRIIEEQKNPPILTDDETRSMSSNRKSNTSLMALNTSQTATLIEDIKVLVEGAETFDITGGNPNNEKAHFDGNIPVPPGESRKIYFKMSLEDVPDSEYNKILSNKELPIKAMGDFETQELDLRVKTETMSI